MNSEVRELHDAARQVVSDQGLAADEQAGWSLVSDLGWLMVATPEELDGLGMGLAGACALHRELGRGLTTVPFISALLGIDAVGQSSRADREDTLARLMAGEDYVAAPLADAGLVAESGQGGQHRLSGTLSAVPSADRASHVLVCAQDCVALVPLDRPGMELRPRATWDQTRRLFDLELSAVEIDTGLTLALGEDASALTQRLAILRDFALAAEAVGGAEALLEMTVEYLQTRQQFGRPLAMFQALKHRCADLKALTEGAEALLQDALARASGPCGDLQVTRDAELAGLAARQLACSAYATVAEEALQLHGGIGMTSEHDCHLFLKRAMLNEHLGRQPGRCEADLAASLIDT